VSGDRHFNDYLTPTASQASYTDVETTTPTASPLITTSSITTMMNAIKRSGNIDLAIHVLRTSLRDAADMRQLWLGQFQQGMAGQEIIEGGMTSASVKVEGGQSIPSAIEQISDVVQPTPTMPPTPEIAMVELPQRRLLVSAQWFEAVHLLARTGSDTIWAALEIRRLMDTEIQALAEEHLMLSGISIEDSLDDISPTAPIYSIQTTGGDKQPFDPAKYLRNLRKTYLELSKLSTISVQQQERRREVTRAKNARRAERNAVALKAEQEKVEAKQALRKQRRDEIQEVPLALA
jgi:hypothetical protein